MKLFFFIFTIIYEALLSQSFMKRFYRNDFCKKSPKTHLLFLTFICFSQNLMIQSSHAGAPEFWGERINDILKPGIYSIRPVADVNISTLVNKSTYTHDGLASSGFCLPNPVMRFWSTRGYSSHGLAKGAPQGTEPGTTWLEKRASYPTATPKWFTETAFAQSLSETSTSRQLMRFIRHHDSWHSSDSLCYKICDQLAIWTNYVCKLYFSRITELVVS